MQVSGNYNDHQCRLETLMMLHYGQLPILVMARHLLLSWLCQIGYIYCLRSSKAACQDILMLDITSVRDLSSPTLHRKEFHHGL
jgi:hypothetical protein